MLYTLPAHDEAMVELAYGRQKKEHVSVSAFSISGEELLKSRSSNLFIALQGRLPGLNIIQSGGEPGKESFFAIMRGYDSPVNNSVLFLIDGVERNPYGIDINEIETITVLKDAAATAMYGMRGAGGAVLIATKKGFNGQSKTNISIDHSLQTPTFKPNFVSAYDYALMYNERVNNGVGTLFSEEELEHYRTGDLQAFYPTRNVVDDFMKHYSQTTRANVNFSGGSDAMRFFTSVAYQHQGSLFEYEPFDEYSYDAQMKNSRVNFRANMDMTINQTLDAWVYIGGFLESANGPYAQEAVGINGIMKKLYETPNNAYHDLSPDGEVLIKEDKITTMPKASVFGMLNRTGSSRETETRIGNNFGACQDLGNWIEGLSASAQVTFDVFGGKIQNRSRSYEAWKVAPYIGATGADSLGYAVVDGTQNTTLNDGINKFFHYMYNIRASLDYELQSAKHYLASTLMGERQMEQQQAYLPANYIGLAARVNYAYDDKYLAEVNMAYQGSEQFAKGSRYGLFPSLSLG